MRVLLIEDEPIEALPVEVLIVTGMSGAGRVTVMKALEDLGWEVVDNLPMSLLTAMLDGERREGHGRAGDGAAGGDRSTR